MAKLTDNSIMPFGKHKGEKLANIPADYLIWIFENNKCSVDVAKYIADNLECLKQEIKYKSKIGESYR